MATTTPWLDLSAYGLRLQVVATPGGRPVLYVTGPTEAHQRALIALGFQRTPGGHIVKPDGKLAAAAALARFPAARLRDLPVADVVRRVNLATPPRSAPSASAPPDEPPTPASGRRVAGPQNLPDALSALVQRAARGWIRPICASSRPGSRFPGIRTASPLVFCIRFRKPWKWRRCEPSLLYYSRRRPACAPAGRSPMPRSGPRSR